MRWHFPYLLLGESSKAVGHCTVVPSRRQSMREPWWPHILFHWFPVVLFPGHDNDLQGFYRFVIQSIFHLSSFDYLLLLYEENNESRQLALMMMVNPIILSLSLLLRPGMLGTEYKVSARAR